MFSVVITGGIQVFNVVNRGGTLDVLLGRIEERPQVIKLMD